jgi:predicted alpha/beta hydrolase family esterase
MRSRLEASQKFSEVVLKDMPDPMGAKESIWIPFMLNQLRVDESTIVVGHSSGAVAAMRLLETTKLLGII